jgi:2-dehydropantoate 2-reductase
MRVAVIGVGGIGGPLAARLQRSGVETAVVARGGHLDAIRTQGLEVIAPDGRTRTPFAQVADDLRAVAAPEIVFVCVKAHQMPALADALIAAADTGATIVTMQNGVPFWMVADGAAPPGIDPDGRLRRSLSLDRLVGAVVHASGAVEAPGVVRAMGRPLYPIGPVLASGRSRAAVVAELLRSAGCEAPLLDEDGIRREVWVKLAGNAALNPVSALTRATVGAIFADARLCAVIEKAMAETFAVARACGCDPHMSAAERLAMAQRTVADVQTSMLQDVLAGRALELEPIVGAVRELGTRHGIPTPTLDVLYALTSALERSAVRPIAAASRGF